MLYATMSPPIIGLTASRTNNKAGNPQISLSEAYASAMVTVGAIPVIIPLGLTQSTLQLLIDHLDGILFTGGGDVHPQLYGSSLHPLVSDIETERDRTEIALIKYLIELKKPFMGICRGLQVINVALGGSLYEDLLEQRPGSMQHKYAPDYPRDYLAHEVEIQADSRLANILETTHTAVNSLHHQGIRELAPGLIATAHAMDGVIEAVELPHHPFALAVQWHPECLMSYPPMQALFRAFVRACEK